MKISFITNYYNHHQSALSESLYSHTNGSFAFLETEKMNDERLCLGWEPISDKRFCVSMYENSGETAFQESNVILAGTVSQSRLRKIIRSNKLLFRYTERPLKTNKGWLKVVPRYIKWHLEYPSNKKVFLLCASAFCSADFSRFGLFENRTYKWGYFPETKLYNENELFENKDYSKILWCGRLIEWKHPEAVIDVARRLKSENINFSIEIIGSGEKEGQLYELIKNAKLQDNVKMLGAMPPKQVRQHMEQAGIFLFTSDKQEGWGAVLNESMNSGCAVVASHIIGAVPYLLKHGENGTIYRDGDLNMLYENVKFLLKHPDVQRKYGRSAYLTITETWNAEVASERFVNLAQRIIDGEESPELYESGPCSKAEIIQDDWF